MEPVAWFILRITAEPLRYDGFPGQSALLPCVGQQSVEGGREEGQGPGRGREPCGGRLRKGWGKVVLQTFSLRVSMSFPASFPSTSPALLHTQRLNPQDRSKPYEATSARTFTLTSNS